MFWRRRGLGSSGWREALWQECEPFAGLGEQIRHVIVARAGEPPNTAGRVFLAGWLAVAGQKEPRIFCVTDRSILILRADGRHRPEAVMARLPREVRLGPLGDWHGEWFSLTGLGGGMFVHQAFREDIVAADAELGFGPEDWDLSPEIGT